MKNMTIGKKIAFGFGLLLLIAALLGGMSIISMRLVQNQAQTLAEGFVPETQIAANLQDAIANARLAARSYGFTADHADLDNANKAMAEALKQEQVAQKLSDAHPELVKLHAALKDLPPLLQSFDDLIAQTAAKNQDIAATRNKLNSSAADFMANIQKLITAQKSRLDNEIKAFTEAPKLEERTTKLMLAVGVRDDGNAARIAAFKFQALRDPKLIQQGLKNFDDMDQKFDKLLGLLKVPEDIVELNGVKADAHAYRDAMQEIMADYTALDEISQERTEVSEHANDLASDTQATGMKRTVDAANTSSQTLTAASWKMVIGLVGALVVGFFAAYFIIRNSNRVLTGMASALDDGSNQVSSAAGQVSSASQTLADGAGLQASSLEQTSSSLEEMSSMTKRNSENARRANELAKQAREAADKGVGDMQTMSTAMEGIKASSDDIAKIIKTIDEIAFQTNILALNAAVEAARAGEAGMGFAVVADEVRNLAQRCAQAAKETSGKIEGAIIKSGQGVEISGKVAAALHEIVTKVRQVDELVTEVAAASREQTEGITQINVAVSQMDKVTQGNAASAEESAAAAEELSAQAATMKGSVAELLLLVGSQAKTGDKYWTTPGKPMANGTHGRHAANGHNPRQTTSAQTVDRRSEIPLENSFKDF